MTKKLIKAELPLIPGKDYILQGYYDSNKSVTFIGPSHIDPKYGVFYVGQVYRPCHYDYIYREVKTKTMWGYVINYGNEVSGSTLTSMAKKIVDTSGYHTASNLKNEETLS